MTEQHKASLFVPNFLTPSIQSTVVHLTPVEQTFEGKHPQTPASHRNAHQSLGY
ncbi:hypothetical protein LC653_43575 [Nostoc sp. CHAB 5784]|uniref:hypothetical protein n=1 Tax=Nostoc mirabile TaxID=2907820 RepID=UPI001E385538|nr:hypothetical protein [Nostoc mirabile]MCC5670481.1 hypothetical protein [Nostoc mirabile CHAB5784]